MGNNSLGELLAHAEEADYSPAYLGNFEVRAKFYAQYIELGILTPNEVRKIEKLPPISDPQADMFARRIRKLKSKTEEADA